MAAWMSIFKWYWGVTGIKVSLISKGALELTAAQDWRLIFKMFPNKKNEANKL